LLPISKKEPCMTR